MSVIEFEPELKTCRGCGKEQPRNHFMAKKISKGVRYRGPDCKTCRAEVRRENYSPDYNANGMLKKNYGITLADYDAMVEKQGGKCAICESTKPKTPGVRFAVDHDHKTGKVRGLLCGPCNAGIGKLGDDIALLTAAIEYLRDHSNV